jgi:hypothetical protein
MKAFASGHSQLAWRPNRAPGTPTTLVPRPPARSSYIPKRANHTATLLTLPSGDQELWVIGGQTLEDVVAEVWALNLRRMAWRQVHVRCGPGCAAVEGRCARQEGRGCGQVSGGSSSKVSAPERQSLCQPQPSAGAHGGCPLRTSPAVTAPTASRARHTPRSCTLPSRIKSSYLVSALMTDHGPTHLEQNNTMHAGQPGEKRSRAIQAPRGCWSMRTTPTLLGSRPDAMAPAHPTP